MPDSVWGQGFCRLPCGRYWRARKMGAPGGVWTLDHWPFKTYGYQRGSNGEHLCGFTASCCDKCWRDTQLREGLFGLRVLEVPVCDPLALLLCVCDDVSIKAGAYATANHSCQEVKREKREGRGHIIFLKASSPTTKGCLISFLHHPSSPNSPLKTWATESFALPRKFSTRINQVNTSGFPLR